MPRILKTVVPRIRKSIADRGLLVSAFRSVLLPLHLLREYKEKNRQQAAPTLRSDFDRKYGVETDGDVNDWTDLSDLEIPSKNWIRGHNYSPIEPEQFRIALSLVPLQFERFVFLDFGSGKGRALLLASELPFKRVAGIEFSPQLHAVAQRNIERYHPPQRRCAEVESVCCDFLEYPLPCDPSVLFFFNPCDKTALSQVIARIGESLNEHARELYVIYVAPDETKERMLDSAPCLTKIVRTSESYVCVYKSRHSEEQL